MRKKRNADHLEQLRALENGMSILVVKVDAFDGIGVDRPEDILKVEEKMRSRETMADGAIARSSREGSFPS